MRTAALLLITALTAATLPVDRVWRAPAGTFIESIAPEPGGSLLLTNLYHGEILRRSADGTVSVAAQLPDYFTGSPGFICLVRDASGAVYASYLSGSAAGIWRITSDGRGTRFATLPAGASPNGLAFDGRGGLIVADNGGGLWRVDLSSGDTSRWLEHPLLSRRPYGPGFPAANGVQRDGNRLLVSNSDRGLLVEVAIGPDGKPGRVQQRAANVAGDDFAVDADGTAYVTTHPQNTVVAVARDGRQHIFATAAQGLAGPTTAVIETGGGRRWLLVANDGGAFARVPVADQRPGLIRLPLGKLKR